MKKEITIKIELPLDKDGLIDMQDMSSAWGITQGVKEVAYKAVRDFLMEEAVNQYGNITFDFDKTFLLKEVEKILLNRLAGKALKELNQE